MHMKTFAILFSVLCCTIFGQQPGTNLVPMEMELSRMRQQLLIMQQVQAKGVSTYVPGETTEQRKARHARVLIDAEAAYKADWQAKNPLLPSFRAPAFHKQLADRALAESDAQMAANAGAQRAQQPDNRAQLAAIQKRIKALEAQIKAAARTKK